MRKLKIPIAVFAAIIFTVTIFVLRGCFSEMPEPTPRDIKILFNATSSWDFISETTLLRIVDGNVLEVTVFTAMTPLCPKDRTSILPSFDNSLIEDFIGLGGYNVLSSFFVDEGVREIPNHWILNRGKRELSQRQLDTIWTLAENVEPVRRRRFPDVEPTDMGNPPPLAAWVIIDGEVYWSLYYDSLPSRSSFPSEFTNTSLLHLVYYFMDLSPIRTGFEMTSEEWGDLFWPHSQ